MKYKWFTAAFLSLCLIPAAGMLVLPEQQAAGNEHLTPKPSLWNAQTGWNTDFLGDLTDYVADHFGFRQELVTANAALQTRLLCTSPAEDVIYGTDGWLYYAKTLDARRQPKGECADVAQPFSRIFRNRPVARRKLDVCPLGTVARLVFRA